MKQTQRLENRSKNLGLCTAAEKRPLGQDCSENCKGDGMGNAGRNGGKHLHVVEKPVKSKHGEDSREKNVVGRNTSTDKDPQGTMQKAQKTSSPLNTDRKHNRHNQNSQGTMQKAQKTPSPLNTGLKNNRQNQKLYQSMTRSPEYGRRNKNKKQKSQDEGPEISRLCVLMILLGIAVIILLAALVVYLQFGSSHTKAADGGGHSPNSANLINKNGSVNYLGSNTTSATSAAVPTRWDMNIILILIAVIVVFVLSVFLYHLKNRKLQCFKQTLPPSSCSTSRESMIENCMDYSADKLGYFENKVQEIETESLVKTGTDSKLDSMSEISEETTANGSNKMGKKKELPVFHPTEENDSIDEDQQIKAACQSKTKEAKCFKDSVSLEGTGTTFTTENEFRAEICVYQKEEGSPKGNLSTSRNLQGDEWVNARLNFDQILVYLACNMPQSNSTKFFQELYGCGLNMLQEGTSVFNIITQVEKNNEGAKPQEILLGQFHEWRHLLGNEARPSHIKDALTNMGYIETLENFEKYVRESSLPPKQNGNLECCSEPLPVNSPTKPIPYEQFSKTKLQSYQTQEWHPNGKNMFVRQNQESQSSTSSSNSFLFVSEPNLNDTTNHRGPYMHWTLMKSPRSDSSSEYDTDCPSNSLKIDTRFSGINSEKRTQLISNYPVICHKLVHWEDDTHSQIIELIKRLISAGEIIKEKEYTRFMYHTVEMMMKSTKESEMKVLSITCDDFDKCREIPSKRGYVIYAIDSEFGFLNPFGAEEWNCLKLYKQQRDHVCQRKRSENSAVVCSLYFFIDYNGQPVKNQDEKEDIKDTDYDQKEYLRTRPSMQSNETRSESSACSSMEAKEYLIEESCSRGTTPTKMMKLDEEEGKGREQVEYDSQVLGNSDNKCAAVSSSTIESERKEIETERKMNKE
ncbi:uncharacterized protein LOC128559507 [Mercenaria mercenaria]|uniref:uncharacterized protein LOC128559507 n=1 Tax=Mercenaria mercenaria TaxID=6596 RepID=UPI00234EA47C|nr:uncharacterized protein LOC128559507 [Mercenaria mercenaria]XP_053407307.1 uncharacterized protein LOC128559507 [Mercenaria mercenaria]